MQKVCSRMKNIPITAKIGLAMAILVLANVFAMLSLSNGISKVNDQSVMIADNWLTSVRILGELNTQTSDFRIAQLQHVGTTDSAVMEVAEKAMADLDAAIEANQKSYAALIVTKEEKQFWDSFVTQWQSYQDQHQEFLTLSRSNQNDAAAGLLYGKMLTAFNDASGALLAGIKMNNQGAENAKAEAEEIFKDQVTFGRIMLAGSVLFAVIIIYALNKAISGPVRAVKTYVAALEAENYAYEVPLAGQNDEFGQIAKSIQSFHQSLEAKKNAENQKQLAEMQEKLDQQQRIVDLVHQFDIAASSAVSSVASAATELSQAATAITEVANSTNDAAKGAVVASIQTAGNVQAVAAAVEQMSAAASEISRQVAKSADIAREATAEAGVARDSSGKMLEATQSIGQVASLIDGIANQINLLALNATIEAVRAGEPGKGFSVVANEIKNLAAQTTEATEKITDQLVRVQGLAEESAEALARLGESVEEVDRVSASISAAVRQQASATMNIAGNMSTAASGVEQINVNITNIQGSTQSTSSATQQILSASMVLSQQAEGLDSDVRAFLDAIKAA